MKRHLPWLLSLLTLTGCGRLDTIPYSPPQTPASWLEIQPFVQFRLNSMDVILVQPTSTLFVYLLGLLAIGGGLYYWRIRHNQHSRIWWAIALLLWGAGALCAGTSYEAFSYQIKCAGRAACIWTSWWEIIYLMLSVASVDAMLLAQAYTCTQGKWRRALSSYAILNLLVYIIITLVGAFIPVKFLISFELLVIFAAPNILIFFILNGRSYLQTRDSMSRALLGAWLWLAVTIGVYFGYLVLNITQTLWARGIWFSENDLLHIGLILWMLYLTLVVSRQVVDMPVSTQRKGTRSHV